MDLGVVISPFKATMISKPCSNLDLDGIVFDPLKSTTLVFVKLDVLSLTFEMDFFVICYLKDVNFKIDIFGITRKKEKCMKTRLPDI